MVISNRDGIYDELPHKLPNDLGCNQLFDSCQFGPKKWGGSKKI